MPPGRKKIHTSDTERAKASHKKLVANKGLRRAYNHPKAVLDALDFIDQNTDDANATVTINRLVLEEEARLKAALGRRD